MFKKQVSQSNKKRTRKFSIRNIISSLLLIFTLGILFYPIVVNYFVGQQNTTTVQRYNQSTNKLNQEKTKQLLTDAQTYNQYIFARSQRQAWQQPIPDYKKQLITDSSKMIGYLSIPQIHVADVPIYSGDDEKTLLAGIGHIPQTSLPVGGNNTHSVLSAHSGHVNNTLFSNLQDLKLGDVFYIHVLGKDLKYQIDTRKIVEPSDTSSINVVANKDLVTLVTCWPIGINNKRLLVTGHRVPNHVELPQEKTIRNKYGYNFWVMLMAALLALLSLLLFLLAFLRGKRHIIRIDRLQFDKIKLENQKIIIASAQVLTSGRKYKENHKLILKAWELVPDESQPGSKEKAYYFQKADDESWQKIEKSKKASKQEARLVWLADAQSFNAQLDKGQLDLDMGATFSRKKRPDGRSLSTGLDLIRERLEVNQLPEDCVLLGIKIIGKKDKK